jgi:hypothetical protein
LGSVGYPDLVLFDIDRDKIFVFFGLPRIDMGAALQNIRKKDLAVKYSRIRS